MEFLTFFAQRLNVSPSDASKLLEQAVNNYRPTRDYSKRMPQLHGDDGLASHATTACALAAHRSP